MNKVVLTPEQERAVEVARIALMNAAPFFAYYYYDVMKEHPTKDVKTAATDGRRIYYNPDYFMSLKIPERVFVLAHEVYHAVMRHPARIKHYYDQGKLRSLPWSRDLFNIAADLIINADLVAQNIGMCNQSWLYDPKVRSEALVEDLYEELFKKTPPQPGAGGGGKSVTGNVPTYGSGRSNGNPDKQAQANGGRFDEVLPPQVDPVTGKEDLPSDAEFKEAVARAATAAKQMGKLPAAFQRLVNEILEPQINWQEHMRMLITGKIGARHETWDRPNRRRLALSYGDATKMVILPGRRGYGANNVAVVIDSSGSIGEKELSVFFAEVGGVLQDVRPRRIYLVHCDAKVHQVDVCASLDELAHLRAQGVKGGGGTDFRPAFDWCAENDVRPDALIYLTDMYGAFPAEAPAYPVIWCATTDQPAPWGEVVRIKVDQ